MDLQCDNLTVEDTGLPAGAAIDKTASGIKDVFKNIRDRAKAKKAQAISDAGGYNTLTPYQKSLIPVPAYALNTTTPTAQDAINADPAGVTGSQLKTYLPYLLGASAVGILVYFIAKRK